MRPNISIKVHSQEEAEREIERLRGYGYEKTSNYPRFERWEKNGWTVEIKKDFRQRPRANAGRGKKIAENCSRL